jgi:hypothetical protein
VKANTPGCVLNLENEKRHHLFGFLRIGLLLGRFVILRSGFLLGRFVIFRSGLLLSDFLCGWFLTGGFSSGFIRSSGLSSGLS